MEDLIEQGNASESTKTGKTRVPSLEKQQEYGEAVASASDPKPQSIRLLKYLAGFSERDLQ